MDTFDYKPELFAKDGKQIDFVGVRKAHLERLVSEH